MCGWVPQFSGHAQNRLPEFLLHHDFCSRAEARQQAAQHVQFESNAACGRRESFARRMNENGAATFCDARTRVVIDFDDEIVEPVFTRQPIALSVRRYFDWPVIAAIVRIFAPAVGGAYPLRRQRCDRTRVPICAPPQSQEPERAARRTAVAFTFICLDAASA